MSKIIIQNNSSLADPSAVGLVKQQMDKGFLSGENQYCWLTVNEYAEVEVHAKPTRGTTHTFEVRDI